MCWVPMPRQTAAPRAEACGIWRVLAPNTRPRAGKLPGQKGKRHHMQVIQQHYGVPFPSMALVDDSTSSLQNEDGYRGILVKDRSAGFTFADAEWWAKADGVGPAPSTSAEGRDVEKPAA